MKKENIKTQFEAYVCTHFKEGKESCAGRGSEELYTNLKAWSKEHKGLLRIAKSSCLGKCQEGIAIACYPDREILIEVTKDEEEELKRFFTSKINA